MVNDLLLMLIRGYLFNMNCLDGVGEVIYAAGLEVKMIPSD